VAPEYVEKPLAGEPVDTGNRATSAPAPQALSIEALSRWTAVVLVFVYVAGFLITSLNDFRYGFTEMNPLRPRILAAGGWFTLFLAVPIALAMELRKHKIWKEQTNRWYKLGILAVAYNTSALFFLLFDGFFFAFEEAPVPPISLSIWQIVGVVGIAFSALVLLFVALYLVLKLPKTIIGVVLLTWTATGLWLGVYDLFVLNAFRHNATILWMLGAGLLCLKEMRARNWSMVVGDWPTTTVSLLALLFAFATWYYPHIMSKWGGGAPLQIRMTLSKDSSVAAGRTVDCSLIDETDAGFYVIGKNEPHATFIPRGQVAMVHFAGGNEHSMFDSPAR
jgi:hypothetical protein